MEHYRDLLSHDVRGSRGSAMPPPYRKKMATLHGEICPSTQVFQTDTHLLLVTLGTELCRSGLLPPQSPSPLHSPASCCGPNTPSMLHPHPSQGLCMFSPWVPSLRVVSPPHSQCQPAFQCEHLPQCRYSSSPSISEGISHPLPILYR